MSAALASRSEVLKLARLLGQPADRLAYLEAAPATDIARVRELATDALFDGDRRRLQGLAESAKHLPVGLLVTIGTRSFGPLLCARLTGLLDPERAAAVGEKMDVGFLARLAAEMDPRRATDVIARMPVETTAAVAAEMARIGEHVAMGRFVGHLSDVAIAACVEQMTEADLLRIAFVLDGDEGLDRVIAMLDDDRLPALGRAAETEGLVDETLYLLDRLSAKQRKRVEAVLSA